MGVSKISSYREEDEKSEGEDDHYDGDSMAENKI